MDTQLPRDSLAQPPEDRVVVVPATVTAVPEATSIAHRLGRFGVILLFLATGLFLGFCIDFCMALFGDPRSLHLFRDVLGWL